VWKVLAVFRQQSSFGELEAEELSKHAGMNSCNREVVITLPHALKRLLHKVDTPRYVLVEKLAFLRGTQRLYSVCRTSHGQRLTRSRRWFEELPPVIDRGMSPIVQEGAVAGKQEKLLGQVRHLMRLIYDSLRTERC